MPSQIDPKGLIQDGYRIEGISMPECRTIFLDWAMSAGETPLEDIQTLLTIHGPDNPDHPMTHVLRAALQDAPSPRRRGGRKARLSGDED